MTQQQASLFHRHARHEVVELTLHRAYLKAEHVNEWRSTARHTGKGSVPYRYKSSMITTQCHREMLAERRSKTALTARAALDREVAARLAMRRVAVVVAEPDISGEMGGVASLADMGRKPGRRR